LNKQLHNQFLDLEVEVPHDVWNTVSSQLPETNEANLVEYNVGQELHKLTELPPVGVWESIVAQLDNEVKLTNTNVHVPPVGTNGAKVISMFKRMAVAASVVGLLLAGYFVINKSNTQVEIAKVDKSTDTVNKIINTSTPNVTPNNDVAVVEQPKNNNPVLIPTVQNPKKELTATKRNQTVETPQIVKDDVATNNHREAVNAVPNPLELNPTSTTGNVVATNSNGVVADPIEYIGAGYITTTGPNGQQVRVSSKLANYINYFNAPTTGSVAPREPIDIIMSESDKWRGIFSSWKEKVNKSNMVSSSANYFDILEFLQLIQ
jgi:hypothetical protein